MKKIIDSTIHCLSGLSNPSLVPDPSKNQDYRAMNQCYRCKYTGQHVMKFLKLNVGRKIELTEGCDCSCVGFCITLQRHAMTLQIPGSEVDGPLIENNDREFENDIVAITYDERCGFYYTDSPVSLDPDPDLVNNGKPEPIHQSVQVSAEYFIYWITHGTLYDIIHNAKMRDDHYEIPVYYRGPGFRVKENRQCVCEFDENINSQEIIKIKRLQTKYRWRATAELLIQSGITINNGHLSIKYPEWIVPQWPWDQLSGYQDTENKDPESKNRSCCFFRETSHDTKNQSCCFFRETSDDTKNRSCCFF
jgi:hypothetical protein